MAAAMPRNTPHGEERGGDLLQPQPGRAQRARDHVAEHRQREHEDAHAAQDHQHGLQPVERLPFQVAVALQDQRAEIGHLRDQRVIGRAESKTRRRAALRRATLRPRESCYFTSRTSFRILTACGPSSTASWSWIGCRGLHEAGLVDVFDDLSRPWP